MMKLSKDKLYEIIKVSSAGVAKIDIRFQPEEKYVFIAV